MVWSKLIRGAGLWAGTTLILVSVAAAQDAPEGQGPEGHGGYPPPAFFTPPGNPTDGAILMHPPIPPGGGPQVFWYQGNGPQEMIKPSDHWVGLQCGKIDPALQAQLGLEEGRVFSCKRWWRRALAPRRASRNTTC